MRFAVLGTLQVTDAGTSVITSALRPRQLLAVLLCSPSRHASSDALVDALWRDLAPPSAVRNIATYVHRLRQTLGNDRLVHEAPGYRLRVDPGELDAERFEELARSGQEALRTGDPGTAATDLAEALTWWRGTPYADLLSAADECPEPVQLESDRLQEVWLGLVEDHADAELALGRHASLVPRLQTFTTSNPLRERARAQLMLALYRSGRTAEALENYRAARSLFIEELGLEPAADLRMMEGAILAEDASLDPPASADRPTSAAHSTTRDQIARTPPRRLPIAPVIFSGRATEQAVLDGLLATTEDAPASGGLVALHGIGGVGKTTLALQWAHRVADRFPDGQLFVNLRGHGPTEPLGTNDALGSLLLQLGVDPLQVPVEDDARRTKFIDLIADRRLLIMFDNARDSAQLRPLLPGGRHFVLVTSRSQLRSLVTHDGARRVAVQTMDDDEAVALLADRLAAHPSLGRIGSKAELAELASLCGHLPIALAVVAERADRYERLPLAELAAELQGHSDKRLAPFTAWQDDPATSVRAVLSWSYEALDESAARQIRLLGLHPTPSFDAFAASWLAGTSLSDTNQVLDRLTEAHLLTETIPGEFEMHDLVRALAADIASAPDHAEESRKASMRMRSGYLHTLAESRSTFHTPDVWVELPPPKDNVLPRVFGDSESPSGWYRQRFATIVACMHDAVRSGDHRWVFEVVTLLDAMVWHLSPLRDQAQVCDIATRSAEMCMESDALAVARGLCGVYSAQQGSFAAALDNLDEALMLFGSCDPQLELAAVLFNMRRAIVLQQLGRHKEAIAVLEECLRQNTSRGLPTASTLNNLALAHLDAGDVAAARVIAERALVEARAEGRTHPISVGLDTLGTVCLRIGEPVRARECFIEAIELETRVSGPDLATVVRNLGHAERDLGHHDRALASWHEALRQLEASDSENVDVSRRELSDLIRSVETSS